MSTRIQRKKNIQQENVSDCNFSFVLVVNVDLDESDVMVAGPFKAKSPGVEGCALERIRVSLKEEITSERKGLVLESQNELLKLLKSKPNANAPRENEKAQETSLVFYTPPRFVKKNNLKKRSEHYL